MAFAFSPRFGVSLVRGGAGALELLRASSGNRGGSGKLPSSEAEALSIINGFRDPGAAPLTANDVYIHYLEAANNSFIGDRFLFLGESTLKNLAEDAAKGFAFMNSHRTGGWLSSAELPMGRTFCGRYEKVEQDENPEPGSPSHRVVAGIYMKAGVSPNGASGPSTDDLHAMIDARTVFDCSVGVYGGKIVCDVLALRRRALLRDVPDDVAPASSGQAFASRERAPWPHGPPSGRRSAARRAGPHPLVEGRLVTGQLVDEPIAGVLGVEPLAGHEEGACMRLADLRQHERADHGWDDPELGLGEAERRGGRGDHDVGDRA